MASWQYKNWWVSTIIIIIIINIIIIIASGQPRIFRLLAGNWLRVWETVRSVFHTYTYTLCKSVVNPNPKPQHPKKWLKS